MSERRGLHTSLGILGLAAWLLFILGCTGWPSWSPDGTKILAPYVDPNAKQEGIALYDLKARTVRSIFLRPSAGQTDDGRYPAYAQWESDGKRAIVIWGGHEGDSLEVTLLPIGSGWPARHFSLRNRKRDTPLLPLPELNGFLFVGGKQISMLNLRTGENLSTPLKREVNPKTGERVAYQEVPQSGETLKELEPQVYLHSDGSRILYDRGLEEEDALEIGTLDANDLSLHPLFRVPIADLKARGLEDPMPGTFVTPEPRGALLAIHVGSKNGDSILLCSQDGLESILQPDFGLSGVRMGLPQWAPGGKLLYVPAAAVVKEGVAQYWVAEVPIAGGRVRLTPIARFKAEEGDWDASFRLSLQVSLSPDGSTLATTTAGLSEKMMAPETKRALYLVNLRDPKRTVTSIPAPLSSVSVKTAKEQK